DTRLYTESNAFIQAENPDPDPEIMETIKGLVARSKEICTRRLKGNPRDTQALYALGIAFAIEANYEFTFHKRWFAALKAGNKAREHHAQLKRLDPNFHDADVVLGLYDYAVGSIPAALKWLAVLAGYRGNKERGIQLLHSALTQGRLHTTDAAILLIVIYNREKKLAYTRLLLEKLAEYYPRNYLLPLEVARTYLREGNERTALTEYLRLAKKVEAGAPGYDRVARDRLYYQIGSLQQHQGEYEAALAAFEKAVPTPEADGLLSAYVSVRKGEIFLAQKRPQQARQECDRVLALPYPEPRAEAERLLLALDGRKP
ncbi:MAG: DUF3808 domain-containing protein, partial [Acidobacteria bacterium]|nr:DUF3808 domain-containing protein [Acidobacteriota bacterium]